MSEFVTACPLPVSDYSNVLLAHGGGGRLMHQLIEKLMLPAFDNPLLGQQHDGAVIEINGARLAFTSDSYVVRPLFFPAATSARSRSMAQSTTSPCAALGRSG
jgi:hydrogenase expression/formation protein HypE